LENDPENLLLARSGRNRLMGEFIRDQALAVSGLLANKLGGPSVKPYHPPGIYEQLTGGGTTDTYVPGTGEDLFRRSLYTYWKRSVPHPAMLSFGTPFREVCGIQRPRSNTPLQALNLMNDPTYVEASRFLAVRMMESSAVAPQRLAFGFRTALARPPRPAEMTILERAHQRALADFVRSGHVAGYGADVLDPEPVQMDNPLLGVSNVHLTPHIGSRTYESVVRQGSAAVDNLIRALKDRDTSGAAASGTAARGATSVVS
jgi:hypothetical protein